MTKRKNSTETLKRKQTTENDDFLKSKRRKCDLNHFEDNEKEKLQLIKEVFRVPRVNFPRRKVVQKGIDDTFQIDLIDVSNLSTHNSGVKFVLTCICIFSKYAWARPLQNKKGITVKEALQSIFDEGRVPINIHSDESKEILNKDVQGLIANTTYIFFIRTQS